ncbi:c-type cytochrome [Algihabitans albus]|uniref:c-type cytochrome n=1 Tax=Algihabitans albus TaxID=2164067 RepID=UPI0013C34F0F|nr:cytochrome c family protein [Algihabitans albus]
MSSLEINKIAAAVLTAGLVVMTSGFIADLLVGGHGEAEEDAYPIQLAEGDAGSAPMAEEEPGLEPVLPLLASADPAAGESLTRACAACHSFDQGGAQKVGPNLWDIVNAPHAHIAEFAYSDALMAMADEPWTYEDLNAFLASPRDYAPGTKMSYAGMRSVEDRANLIAYLRSLSEDPAPLPTAEEIEAVTGGGEADAEAAPAEEDASEAAPTEEQASEATSDEAETSGTAGETQEAAADAGTAGAIVERIAAADPAAGQRAVRACAACHTFDEGGANRVGPNLWNTVGASVAHLDDFNYSNVFQEKHEAGEIWTYEALWEFLKNPREWAPGNRMTYAGVRDEDDKAAIIAYLRSLSSEPAPLEPLQ